VKRGARGPPTATGNDKVGLSNLQFIGVPHAEVKSLKACRRENQRGREKLEGTQKFKREPFGKQFSQTHPNPRPRARPRAANHKKGVNGVEGGPPGGTKAYTFLSNSGSRPRKSQGPGLSSKKKDVFKKEERKGRDLKASVENVSPQREL